MYWIRGAMFSGIIEAVQPILSHHVGDNIVQIQVSKPIEFQDLKVGDSIAVNGICLTIEKFDETSISFSLALETLKILDLNLSSFLQHNLNLERSMKFGDRVHGSLVTGHVETLATITESKAIGDSWILKINIPEELKSYFWKKGSIVVHGVSLTINEIHDSIIEVCLIPETQKKTNLIEFKTGEKLNIEPDYYAKAVVHNLQNLKFTQGMKGAQLGL